MRKHFLGNGNDQNYNIGKYIVAKFTEEDFSMERFKVDFFVIFKHNYQNLLSGCLTGRLPSLFRTISEKYLFSAPPSL